MNNTVRGFICPHIDDEYSLCQDRLFVDLDKLFFSVSDGVSSSFSPTYYAGIISSYQDGNDVSLSKKDAEIIFAKWQGYIESLLSTGKLGRASKQRYQRGETPSATYARFQIIPNESRFNWNAAVLGDCSIIHARKNTNTLQLYHVILSGEKFRTDNFKYNSDTDYYKFGKLPDQLDRYGTFLTAEANVKHMALEEGDVFFLLTDGVSDWVLNDSTKTSARLVELYNLKGQEDFLKLVERERETRDNWGRNMENDDITVLVIDINEIQGNQMSVHREYVADISELLANEKIAAITTINEQDATIVLQEQKVQKQENNSEHSTPQKKKDEVIASDVCTEKKKIPRKKKKQMKKQGFKKC